LISIVLPNARIPIQLTMNINRDSQKRRALTDKLYLGALRVRNQTTKLWMMAIATKMAIPVMVLWMRLEDR
jgi:hypothetical protein